MVNGPWKSIHRLSVLSVWVILIVSPILIGLNGVAEELGAQSTHAPPPNLPPLPRDTATSRFETVLHIKPADSTAQQLLRPGSRVRIFGGRIVFIGANGSRTQLDLRDYATIGAVADHINAKFEGAIARTAYPEFSSRYLSSSGDPRALSRDEWTEVRGGLGGPTVTTELSGVFTLSQPNTSPTDNRLLSSGGFQIDFYGARALSAGDWILRLRTSFATNDPQLVTQSTDGSQTNAGATASLSEETIIENAERVTMGGIVDYFPINRTDVRLGVSAEVEIAWAAFDPVSLPTVTIDDRTLPLDSIYPEERVQFVEDRVNRVLPATTVFIGPTLRFPAMGELSIYYVLQGGISERISRGVDFESEANPDPKTLTDDTDRSLVAI